VSDRETVGVLVNGNVVGIAVFERVSVTDCVRVTDIVMDLVNGLVVAIPLLDTVCDIDFVNGKVVGTAVFERVSVTDCVRVTDVVIDLVKGNVVGILVFERVSVTD
jgi:uncharacterized membrane protein YjfL (UPF0719 family)